MMTYVSCIIKTWRGNKEKGKTADFLVRNNFNYGLDIRVVSKTDAVHLKKGPG